MEQTEIMELIGFGLPLVWGGFYAWLDDDKKKKKYVIYVGVIINVVLFAISWNFVLLLGGVISGIIFGSIIVGFNCLARKIGMSVRRKMQGWKNNVIFFVILVTMMYLSIAIIMMIQ